MSRKKTKKTRAAGSKSFVNLQKLEMDFLATPAKIVALLDKEIAVLNKQDGKFKKTLDSIQKKINAAEKRVKSAEKVTTAAGKKLLKVAKKNLSELVSQAATFAKQQKQTFESLTTTMSLQSKFDELRKTLSQFGKDWAKKSKNKPQAKPQSKRLKALPKSEAPSLEQTHVANLSVINNDVEQDEFDNVTDIAS